MRTLANSKDQNEMLHYAGSQLFSQTEMFFRERKKYWEIITHYPSTYTMDRPKFIISNHKEESISV